MSKHIKELVKAAEQRGLEVKECANGHYQIIGGELLVNYYPHAKRGSTIYIAGTRSGRRSRSIKDVLDATSKPPRATDTAPPRKKNRSIRKKMLAKSCKCHWCSRHLVLNRQDENPDAGLYFATLDHRIPRSLGGLDHHNNYVLACEDCNARRGSDMPELSKGGAS